MGRPLTDVEVRKVTVTAYSSSPDETDDTPHITAMGTATRHGVIAANFLPFGVKVRIPKLFGDTVFTVEDRMHKRFQNRVDVWFPTKAEAKRFGLQLTEVEIEI
ncbi:MAG: 3D domain-containing protein [Candidatus Sungbacteria bacterium]|uniref:3D domain-containing protein n=1 Tax=Candidatus Sungiibacteriota bacterium TaxID=2750080 RepID=A0A931SB67_9BACT|nr:3D domain-containing protein [Candidatus Sungbacteria bacterium]